MKSISALNVVNNRTVLPLLFAGLLAGGGLQSAAFAIQPSVSEVKDSRTTGQFFAGLEVTVSLVGDEMQEAAAVRVALSSAVDDTGRNLIKDDGKAEFEEINSRGGTQKNSVTLKLKNPARKAETIKEIAGSVELFIPDRDPQARVTLDNALASNGAVLQSPPLQAAGITLGVYTAQQYAEKRKLEIKSQVSGMFQDSMAAALGSGNDKTLTFEVVDSRSRLVKIELLDASGAVVRSNGSMTSGKIKTLYYEKAPDSGDKLRLSILTDKALLKVPLNLNAIALP